MRSCASTSEYIGRGVLAFVLVWLAVILFVKAGKGQIQFRAVPNLKHRKRMAKGIGLFLIGLALLITASTVFGWGCPSL